MKMDKKFMHFVAAAWLQFKKEHIKEAYIGTNTGDEKRIEFVMVKNHWYYGQESYSCFDCGVYVCGFYPEAMDIIAKEFFPGEYKKEEVIQ